MSYLPTGFAIFERELKLHRQQTAKPLGRCRCKARQGMAWFITIPASLKPMEQTLPRHVATPAGCGLHACSPDGGAASFNIAPFSLLTWHLTWSIL